MKKANMDKVMNAYPTLFMSMNLRKGYERKYQCTLKIKKFRKIFISVVLYFQKA